jgi:hypothetical protein
MRFADGLLVGGERTVRGAIVFPARGSCGVVIEIVIQGLRQGLRQGIARPDDESACGVLHEVVRHLVADLAGMKADRGGRTDERVVRNAIVEGIEADAAAFAVAEENVVEDAVAPFAPGDDVGVVRRTGAHRHLARLAKDIAREFAAAASRVVLVVLVDARTGDFLEDIAANDRPRL